MRDSLILLETRFKPSDRFTQAFLQRGLRLETKFYVGATRIQLAPRLAVRLTRLPGDFTGEPREAGDSSTKSLIITSRPLPKLIGSARRNGAPSIEAWGSGNVSREFLYVEDCADGILRAAKDYDGGDQRLALIVRFG